MNKLCILPSLCLATSLYGAQITDTNSTGYLLTDVNALQLTLPTFNPALGLLTSVSLTETATAISQWSFTSFYNNGSAEAECNITFYFSDGAKSESTKLDLPTFSFEGLAAKSTINSPVYTASQQSQFTDLSVNGLLPTINFSTATLSFVSESANMQFSQSTHVEVSTIATYTYTPIPTPEPNELALAGLGMCSLIVFRRYR